MEKEIMEKAHAEKAEPKEASDKVSFEGLRLVPSDRVLLFSVALVILYFIYSFPFAQFHLFPWYRLVPASYWSWNHSSRTVCDGNRIDAVISYGTRDFGQDVGVIYRALTTCKKVDTLNLGIYEGGHSTGHDIFSFPWKEGQNFTSQLEHIQLSGYDWDRANEAEKWSNAMDWSKVRTLDIARPPNSFLETFKGELHSLESLSIRPQWGYWGNDVTFCEFDASASELRQNYTDFVAALPPLKSLSISGMGEHLNLSSILATHGSTLESLIIHEFERDCEGVEGFNRTSRAFLTLDQLDLIRTSTPKLKTLEMDVHRNGTWPTAVLSKLQDFPALEELVLYFDDQDSSIHLKDARCRRGYRLGTMKPVLNNTSAGEISRSLLVSTDRLRMVTLYSGDWPRRDPRGWKLEDCKNLDSFGYACERSDEGVECMGIAFDDYINVI